MGIFPCHHFFILQFNAKHKKEDKEDNALECVVVYYCFVIMEVCKEEDNMGAFLHCHFFFTTLA